MSAVEWREHLMVKALEPGDACQVQFPARSYWMPAKVITNGGYGYWEAELTEEVHDDVTNAVYPVGHRVTAIYSEHVRTAR